MSARKNLPDQAYEGIVSETYNGVEMRNYEDRPDNLVDMLETSVARFGDREALVDGPIRLTYGEYDLICKVESNSLEELDNFIFNKIRTTDGVTATTTLLQARPKDIIESS